MPIYIYQCPECGVMYEKLRAMEHRDEPVICGLCDHDVRCKRKYTAIDFFFKKHWTPTDGGWRWKEDE